MTIYLPNVHHAKRELTRLREIETDLQSKVIELLDSNHYMASCWRSVYTDRLRYNVRPAIKECERYIKSQA